MFKDRLKQLRNENHLTQEELANKIHVSRSAICKWELGKGIPSDVNVEGLCDLFNVKDDWLLDRQDLKTYIEKKRSVDKKIQITSTFGLIVSFGCIILTFVGMFSHLESNPDYIYIAPIIPAKSIFDYLGTASAIPLFCYILCFVISFLNLIRIFKDDKVNKIIILNFILLTTGIIVFIASFAISIQIASESGNVINVLKGI